MSSWIITAIPLFQRFIIINLKGEWLACCRPFFGWNGLFEFWQEILLMWQQPKIKWLWCYLLFLILLFGFNISYSLQSWDIRFNISYSLKSWDIQFNISYSLQLWDIQFNISYSL